VRRRRREKIVGLSRRHEREETRKKSNSWKARRLGS